MDTYIDNTPLWDLSHASNFSQIADDDFLALLQKQFPTGVPQQDRAVDAVNPQNISRYSLPSFTPPSEDSSPSPPNLNNEQNGSEDGGDSLLKRKASEDDFDDAPNSKSQHTSANKKNTATRRKSSGASGPPKDETRLLKRKEQNRAAQRAFRERKEKHVKDLEDKVAALEAKNEEAVSENENLRDLLTRLQHENLSLKQSSFTFAVPKNGNGASGSGSTPASTSFASQSPEFTASPAPQPSISPTPPSTAPTKLTNPLEWSSLTSFDPAMLNLLDDGPQPTATDGAMQMDFGFGNNSGLSPNTPFTTIASNPMFMSFASAFDTPQPQQSNNNSFNFDMNGFSSWPSPPSTSQDTTLDDLLAGYMPRGTTDFSYMPTPSSTSGSPVTHHTNFNNIIKTTTSQSPSFSSSSSPSSTVSDPLFDTPRDSSASDSDNGHEKHDEGKECPKTKADLVKRIVSSGPSPFAPTNLRKCSDGPNGSVIMCEGTKFPQTQESDQNIEVLSAWRSITSNPRYKDIDINDLCTEFTNKAKCDGTKVVLEPNGVTHILQNLMSSKK